MEIRQLPTDAAARDAGYYFDIDSAERVRKFCRRFLRHSKGGFADKPFDLLDWQWYDLIAPVFGWKRPDGRRRFNRVYVEIPKKNGKPLAIDTLIPTAAGWVSMGDIQPGETVFDETGSPCRVVAVSAVMHGKPCYRLTFADGTSVVAAGDHHWVTRSRTNPKRWACRSTEQMYRTPPATDGGHNYYLPVAGALVGGAGRAEFDPYTFGFWLGNGHTTNGELAVNNADVADVIRWMTGVRRVRPNGVGDSSLVVVNGLRNYTSGLGIKHYTQKYIPQCFLRAAVMYRWWLLQGLMDSDGCVGPKGQCVYVTGVPRLRDSVLELIRSLGFKTTCNYVDDTARTDRNCNGHWRILFTADSSTPISRLDRKQRALPAPSARRSRSLTNAIVSIDPVDSVPVRCIQVDSPSHQYLCGPGFTPTHNSTLCAALALYLLIADREQGAEVYCLDPATPILGDDFRWRRLDDFRIGDGLIAFDEDTPVRKDFRKLRRAEITSCDRITQPCYEIVFDDGRKVIASETHKWFGCRLASGSNKDWVMTRDLIAGASSVRSLCEPWTEDRSFSAGYLAGVFDGEACFQGTGYRGGFRIAFAQRPGDVMNETRGFLQAKGYDISPCRKHASGCDTFEIRGLESCFRFLGSIRPRRLLANAVDWCVGRAPSRGGYVRVASVRFLGDREVIAVGTTTKTLFANGLFSHNSAAADRDQASIVYNEAFNMVRASEGLSDVIVPVKSKKLLEFPHSKAIYKALSADVPTKEGLNIHGLIFDELHAQKTRKLWDTLKYGGRAREQPISIAITTAGYDRQSICWEQHLYAESIADGSNLDDLHYYPYIRSAGLDDDWTDPAVWRKANPSFGITIREDVFAQECREAQMSAVAENTFRRYSLNQWTQQDVRWLNMVDWDKCGSIPDDEDLIGSVCYGGLDLATTDDMNALVLFWPEFCACKCWFWVPEACVRNRAVRARFRYDGFIQKKVCRTTPGNKADYHTIRADIVAVRQQYKKLRMIGVDKWNSSQIVFDLMAAGVKLEGFHQGFASLNGPTKDLELYVRTGKLQHGGNEVLRWHAGNVAVETDAAANWKPSKKSSGEKIDGIVALIMAIGLANKAIRRKSIYSDKGIDAV